MFNIFIYSCNINFFLGDGLNLPTLIMAPNFDGGLGLISSNEYLNGPQEAWQNQNNFFRQVKFL